MSIATYVYFYEIYNLQCYDLWVTDIRNSKHWRTLVKTEGAIKGHCQCRRLMLSIPTNIIIITRPILVDTPQSSSSHCRWYSQLLKLINSKLVTIMSLHIYIPQYKNIARWQWVFYCSFVGDAFKSLRLRSAFRCCLESTVSIPGWLTTFIHRINSIIISMVDNTIYSMVYRTMLGLLANNG